MYGNEKRYYCFSSICEETMKKKIMLFAQLVSEIDISRYKQKEYVNIVKAIYWEIFGKKA